MRSRPRSGRPAAADAAAASATAATTASWPWPRMIGAHPAHEVHQLVPVDVTSRASRADRSVSGTGRSKARNAVDTPPASTSAACAWRARERAKRSAARPSSLLRSLAHGPHVAVRIGQERLAPAVRLVRRGRDDRAAVPLGEAGEGVRIDLEQAQLRAEAAQRVGRRGRRTRGAWRRCCRGGASAASRPAPAPRTRRRRSGPSRRGSRGRTAATRPTSRTSRFAQKAGSERPYSGASGKASSVMPQVFSVIIPLSSR